jgi:hypothetical protein
MLDESLGESLRRLDDRLRRAVAKASAIRPGIAGDGFRGLYIDLAEVEILFAQAPAEPLLWTEPDENAGISLIRIAELFALDAFDVDALLIALAPELDLRYERLYAYLQDDVTRRKPTVDLILNLLCASAEEKIARRVHFSAGSPLVSGGVIRLLADPSQLEPPLLSHFVKVDEQILKLVLGESTLDSRIGPYCRHVRPSPGPLDPHLRELALSARRDDAGLRLYFEGPDRDARRAVAEAMAAEMRLDLLVVGLGGAPEGVAALAQREARLRNAILYAEGVDALPDERGGWTILSGSSPNAWPGSIVVRLGPLGYADRERLWRTELAASGVECGDDAVAAAASRFVLTTSQIRSAAGIVRHCTALRAGRDAPTEDVDLFAAARAQCGHALAALARRIEPRHGWDDIVLPEDILLQLRELCGRAAIGRRVLSEWGFERVFTSGKGVTALFMGASGTGKTLAAEVVASHLRLDLYRIDLSGIVSKYIGETEKNLDRVFAAAHNANAILFFDEADALFGKRSEVRDSHDRYANIEIAYLLQKMEDYEGVAILATNLSQHLDESFLRRLAFCIPFPFPDEGDRLRIWQCVWPPEAPRALELDLPALSRRFKLSGGNIRNVALSAAFLAAEAEVPVGIEHIVHGVRREYQKFGRRLSEEELGMEVAP